MYDVAIVGAGPAGSTLARMLSPHLRVLLVDRRQLDVDFEPGTPAKTCGGLLAPAAQHELARQGLGVPAHVVTGPQLFAVRTLDLRAGLERLYQRFYVNADREAFDRWLVSLVPAHVERGFGWTLHSLEPDEVGCFLRFETAERGRAGVRARLVVGTDGATSSVRRLAFPDVSAPERYVAIQAEYGLAKADPYYGAIFDAGMTDFYGWTIPKGDRLVVGAAFRAGDGYAARFDDFVTRLHTSGFRFAEEIARSSAAIARPNSLMQLCPGSGRVLLAGEAAGFISPSSAEGISYALTSAAALANALEPGLAGADVRYRAGTWPIALKLAGKAAKASAIYGVWTRRLIMRSGLGSIPSERPPMPVPATRLVR